jgi:ubiquitin carboxyl-terminal hydrolase 8
MEMQVEDKILYGICRYNNMGGVTCYMNSILHILQQIPIFADYVFNGTFSKTLIEKCNGDEDKIKVTISYELYRLFNVSMSRDDMAITPSSFKKCIGKKNDMWDENNHQDSQEFLTFLISSLEEEIGEKVEFIPGGMNLINKNQDISIILAEMAWKNFQAREYSPLKEMFNGMTVIQTKCQFCSNTNNNYEPYTSLQVSIPIKNVQEEMLKEFTLDECLEHMVKEEQLDKDNLHKCEMCGLKNRAFKNGLFWRTPKILIIHIKRFGINTRKLVNKISYPLYDLDLSNYFSKESPYKINSKYDLIGINLHQEFGFQGINSGHYTSFVKNRLDDNWFLFNDGAEPIKATRQEHLQHRNAYLLFYYRKN